MTPITTHQCEEGQGLLGARFPAGGHSTSSCKTIQKMSQRHIRAHFTDEEMEARPRFLSQGRAQMYSFGPFLLSATKRHGSEEQPNEARPRSCTWVPVPTCDPG